MKDLEPEGMQDALELVKTPDGKTYWDVLKDFKTHVKAWFKIVDLKIPGIDWVVMSKKDFAKLVLKKAPFFARLATLQAILEVEFVFTIPFTMWMEFAEAQVEMRSYWYTIGRITVLRQWLRRLQFLTYEKENNFPSDIDIDITTPVSAEVYYISRYNAERIACGKFIVNFIPAPDRLKDGFDDQAVFINSLGNEIMNTSNEILGDLMRDSDLDACKMEVLRKAGIFDISRIKSLVIRELADELLAKLPTV